MTKLFVLKQMMFKIEMALFIYQMKPNHFQAKTYVNMKIVRINPKEKSKMERRTTFGLNGMKMVRKCQRLHIKMAKPMVNVFLGMRMVR